jgi:uncharacterized protein (TIGR04222 family)
VTTTVVGVVVVYASALLLGLCSFWLAATPLRLPGTPELSPSQIAMLRWRGRRAALVAAITELYAAGLVTVSGRGTLRRGDAPVPQGLSELPRALYRVLVVPRSLRSLTSAAPVRAALRATSAELTATGAAPSHTRWWLSRAALLAALMVTLSATSRVGAVSPLLMLPTTLLVSAAAAAWLLPRRTVAGARLLRRLRHEQAQRWKARSGDDLIESWTPQWAGRVNALTGMVLAGLEPALGRGVRERSVYEGRMDLGDGVSAHYGGGLNR